MDKLLTCREVAQIYGVKPATVWGWIRTGRLKAVKLGRLYRVEEKEAEKLKEATPLDK